MIIKNIKIYGEDRRFHEGSLYVTKERFVTEGEGEKKEVIDGKGCYAIPGLIDVHMHGCKGYDFCDGTKEAMGEIAKYQMSVGVTAMAPATMTLPPETLEEILSVAADYRDEKNQEGADIIGINMEGPFISKTKKGAQDARYILPCDIQLGKRFVKAGRGLVKYIGIAPEESEKSVDFIQEMKKDVKVALAHTNANYQVANEALAAGVSHTVHLYNAMPPYTHREPGVVGAVSDNEHTYAELICDGVHVHGAAVRATFKMLGADRIILVSDSMRATGMKDGIYTLGGQEVEVKGNQARLVSDGALAGSVTNLMDCLRYAVKEMGVSLEDAVGCATINPAKSLGEFEHYGSLEAGKLANLVLLDENLDTKLIMKDGRVRVNSL